MFSAWFCLLERWVDPFTLRLFLALLSNTNCAYIRMTGMTGMNT